MNLDGFHLTERDGRVGAHVAGHYIEHSRPLVINEPQVFRYHDAIPAEGRQDRYFYTGEDIMALTEWSPEHVAQLVRKYRWRSRVDTVTKERGYYLYDLIATVWGYFLDLPYERIDKALYTEAASRRL